MDNPQPKQKPEELSGQPDAEKTPVILNPSYQRAKPFVLTDKDRKAIAWAFASVDREQIRILRTKTAAERVQMAASMIEAVEQVGAYRLRQREPELSEEEALRIVRGGLMNYELNKRRL